MNQSIYLYESKDGETQMEVTFEQGNVWLSQSQIGKLFATGTDNVSLHLKNIFADQELDEKTTTENFSIVRREGRRQVRRKLRHYNLDAIISVGYRVNSSRATQFRIWATRTLKQHLTEGHSLNEPSLRKSDSAELEEAVRQVRKLSRSLSDQPLENAEGSAMLSIIDEYARSWSLLQNYDEQTLNALPDKQANMRALKLEEVIKAIAELKKTLIMKGEATKLFGNLRGDGLASALETIEQGFGDSVFYPNIASRAAHLLYFVIKNHSLTDGNKRIGSFLFLWYLRLNQPLLAKPVEQLINDNTLVALALLVAASPPEQKEIMVRLIEHFILLRN
ncbi:MAG: virulence protein RhuM/Fic/DOC family protein [Cellvibrionales bacterium]|nr:virulence protein RhuM/Fic/DOC family protein [Cellvibrionales bacterium]